jgi:hypothetical protein
MAFVSVLPPDHILRRLRRGIHPWKIKPLGQWQWKFQTFWLSEAVEPASGEYFFLQFSDVDTDCYQRFLDEFSQAYADSLNKLLRR